MNIVAFCMDNYQSAKDASIEALKAWESLPKDREGNSLEEVDFWEEGDGISLDTRQRLHYVTLDGRLLTGFYLHEEYTYGSGQLYMEYVGPFTPL